MRNQGLADAAVAAGLPLRAAIYNRVSKDKTREQRSVSEQGNINLRACEENSWVVERSYVDNHRSASRFATRAREEWDELLEDLAARKYHVLVLWEASRGDRTLRSWIGMLDLCRELGILIHVSSHYHTYDVRRRRDYKTLAEEGVDSADESERTSERILRTVEATADRGTPHGPLPYGFRREYEVSANGVRRIVGQYPDTAPHPVLDEAGEPRTDKDGKPITYTKAGIAVEIITRLARGQTEHSIVGDLNRRRVPSSKGGLWHETVIGRMATNIAYIGRRKHRGLDHGEASWEGLVDPATFERARSRLTDPARKTSHDNAIRYLGTHLYVCGVCGCVVRKLKRKVKKRGTVVGIELRYQCYPGNTGLSGFCVSRSMAEVDAHVKRSIWLRLTRLDMAALLAEDRAADERMAALLDEIETMQGRLDEARDAFAAGSLRLDSLQRIEGVLTPQIAAARDRLQQERVGPVLDGMLLPTLAEVQGAWEDRSLPEQREIIRTLTEKIEIMPLGRRKKYEPDESVNIVWRSRFTG